jgi:dienelactone hydrolase
MRLHCFDARVITALAFLTTSLAWAQPLSADAALIVDAVKKKQHDMKLLCQSDGAGIRGAVTEAIMPLMQQRKLRGNPMEVGLEAGAALRKECVALAPGTTSAEARPAPTSADVLTTLIDSRSRLPKISFNTESKTWSGLTSPYNQLLRPDGTTTKPEAGWPVVVYVPGCGGLYGGLLQTRIAQIKEFLQAGYAVLAIDSYSPRSQTDCRNNVVNPGVVIGDTLQGLDELQTAPDVDKRRIYQFGQSMGGLVAQWVSNEGNMSKRQAKHRFTAVAGHYTSCQIEFTKGAFISLMQNDINRPLLLLMAKDDAETPSDACFPLLTDLKSQGKPVNWHIYPSPITHGWDLAGADGYTVNLPNGKSETYRYNKAVSEDAMRRTLDFFNAQK